MTNVQDFSVLVGDIYDAALDPSLWSLVLEKICRFVPGRFANIFIQDANNRFANSIFTWGVDPSFFKSYLDKYGKLNPFFPAIFFLKVGEVFSAFEVVPPEEFHRSRFYKEWAAPQGLNDSPGVILEKSATSCALFTVTQPPLTKPQSELVLERLRLIAPHLQRAVLIGKAFDLQKAIAADLSATIDALKTAIFLVDGQGRIVHANTGGMTMLATGDALFEAGSELHARNSIADRTLAELFAASANDDDLAIGPRGTAIHIPSRSGKDYVGHVLPLGAGARRETAPRRAVAIVVVHDAAQNKSSPPEVLAKAFGLTAREVTVLLALVETPGVTEIAELMGLSNNTVRAHLRALFAKTGTTRQAELVALVAKFMNPVV